jgi:hypothetical protein
MVAAVEGWKTQGTRFTPTLARAAFKPDNRRT